MFSVVASRLIEWCRRTHQFSVCRRSCLPLPGRRRSVGCLTLTSGIGTCTSDANKTEMLRPRPAKQQQDYIVHNRKKTLLLQHACLSKNNFVQNIKPVTFGTLSALRVYCMKKYACLLQFSIIMSHNVLSGTTVLEARPKV